MNKPKYTSDLNIDDIILDAFKDYIHQLHLYKCKSATDSGLEITNPHYFLENEFVKLEYIDRWCNIIYKERQRGVNKLDIYYEISIAVPYSEYKPYHDKWVKIIRRGENLDKLFNEI